MFIPSLLTPGSCFTTAALESLGIDATARRTLMTTGELRRVTRGLYAASDVEAPSSDTFARRRRQYLQDARAALHLFPGAYLVGPSACVAHRLPLLAPPNSIHLSRNEQIHSVRSQIVSRRSWCHEVTVVDGMRVQEPAAAVIEIAALQGAVPGLVVADAAAHRSLLDSGPELLVQWGRRKGSATARLVLERADGRRESPLESEVAWEAIQAGIDLTPQVRILDEHGQFVAWADFVVTEHRVVVEVDGLGKYRRDDSLRNEKLRQSDIERLGWVVVRILARDVRQGRVGSLLREAVHHAEAVFGPAS